MLSETCHSIQIFGLRYSFIVKLILQFNIINSILLMATLKLRSNGLVYSYTVIGTLAIDGWAVTFGMVRRVLGKLWPCPVPSSLHTKCDSLPVDGQCTN